MLDWVVLRRATGTGQFFTQKMFTLILGTQKKIIEKSHAPPLQGPDTTGEALRAVSERMAFAIAELRSWASKVNRLGEVVGFFSVA